MKLFCSSGRRQFGVQSPSDAFCSAPTSGRAQNASCFSFLERFWFSGSRSGFRLGPRDVFVPGYHCSPRYVQNINITNTRVINVAQVTNVYNNVYVNHDTRIASNYTYAHNTVAVTAVPRDTFVNARSVGRASVRVTGEQIQGARVVDNAPIAPTRTSYISATAKVTNARPAVGFAQRPVVAKLNPAVSRPAPVYTNDSRQFKPRNDRNTSSPLMSSTSEPATHFARPSCMLSLFELFMKRRPRA